MSSNHPLCRSDYEAIAEMCTARKHDDRLRPIILGLVGQDHLGRCLGAAQAALNWHGTNPRLVLGGIYSAQKKAGGP